MEPLKTIVRIGDEIREEPVLLSKEERNDFVSLFPQLVSDLTEISEYRDMPHTNRWLSRVLQYNVPHGKQNRGLSTALAYRYFVPELTPDNARLSYVLGWCVEIIQAFALVADDIMDGSQTRRGRPCWYQVDNLGASGFNDALLLEYSVFKLLKKYFGDKSYYPELLEIVIDINDKTIYGQSLDTRTGLEKKLETYNMDRYAAIVKYKTSFYTFYFPVRLAMAMAGISDPELVRHVRTVTLELGHFFQVQDDFLDCYGDEGVTGKVGTDIGDCKCSWLFVKAVEKCTEEQRKTLWDNYGRNEGVDAVKSLYNQLGLVEEFRKYEKETYARIETHISQMNERLPKQLFSDMLNKIYGRKA